MAAGRVGAQATRARKQQVVAKISLHAHNDRNRHDSGKFTENSGFRRPRTVIRGTVAYSQSHNIQTFRGRQGVDNQICAKLVTEGNITHNMAKISKKKIKSIKFHIEQDDYFGTVATVVDLMRQIMLEKEFDAEANEWMEKLREELMFLQNNYKIVDKNK